MNVLIAEDDPIFRRVIAFTVAKHGFAVTTVGDGGAALERVRAGGIHFLVTDHQMPIRSGIELLQDIVDDADLVMPPTILCTAKGFELDRESLIQTYGLVALLHKPFSPRQLVQMIRESQSTAAA